MTTPKLIITRGLPGSGKTTWARGLVALDPARWARVNRDDHRASMHGGFHGDATERQVTAAAHAAISALLRKGVNVICDDTNLSSRHARELRRLAKLAGAEFEVHDMTDVGVEVCVQRDAQRTGTAQVGRDVITGMHARFIAGRPHPLPIADDPADATVAAPYTRPTGAATAIMVDIDGTVALMTARSPYDETRVHEDRPNRPVIEMVRAMYLAGHEVIFCSGRTDECRDATEKWLAEHIGIPYAALHMRAARDVRKDSVVKLELFDRHIRRMWDIVCVLDDRDQVVRAWRSIGLTVCQVAEGNF